MSARRIASVALVAWLSVSTVAFAQEPFREFASKDDRFAANFPGEPVVTGITWETEYGARIPGRVYTVTMPGRGSYSVTVVDYNPVQSILTARSKDCPPGLERCLGDTSFPGPGYWKNDVRGAMIYTAAKYLKRDDLKMTHYAWSFLGTQAVENNELQFTNLKDKSRTYVNIFMHHSVLYVMEETKAANTPPPGLFVQSMTLKETDGTIARHYGVYFNGALIDPVEAVTCSTNLYPGRGAGAGAGRGFDPAAAAEFAALLAPCETLPAALRFQQGPTPMPAATQAPR